MCACVSFSGGEARGGDGEDFQDVSPQGEILDGFFLRAGSSHEELQMMNRSVSLLGKLFFFFSV